MKLDVNEDNIEEFKVVVWLCLVIGLWNMYLYIDGRWWYNWVIGIINLPAWFNLRNYKLEEK
jgi:hypothetical protein